MLIISLTVAIANVSPLLRFVVFFVCTYLDHHQIPKQGLRLCLNQFFYSVVVIIASSGELQLIIFIATFCLANHSFFFSSNYNIPRSIVISTAQRFFANVQSLLLACTTGIRDSLLSVIAPAKVTPGSGSATYVPATHLQ